jgi:hypothetical protein
MAHALKVGLRRLLANEPRLDERIDVHSLNAVALRLSAAACRHPNEKRVSERVSSELIGKMSIFVNVLGVA